MNITTPRTTKDIVTKWHKINVNGKVLGRVATEITNILMGKMKPTYVPYLNSGDKVVVVNSSKVVLTGAKEMQKTYRSHSGYMGNLKEYRAEEIRKLNPNRMIFDAVKGMLPKNRLRDVRLANLYIYKDENHPHQGQVKEN